MRTKGIAGVTHNADLLVLLNMFSGGNGNAVAVSVQRRQSVAMIDDNIIAVTRMPGRRQHCTGSRSINRRSKLACTVTGNIQTTVSAFAVLGCGIHTAALNRPYKAAGRNAAVAP